ncbi:flavin reductase domain-containing FMN-binding protein (plasmid) [Rhodococcus opacus]|uniref:Flavin reductase domain-containing FMN-binding protein n=1 Tax=Rhodococcus opacus TaxID=37919 RepID=A0A1B1KI67_RHOOP|nr:flavin reductase family protein [Rhodococcus opacus]ANS32297.1 flavin reductase domain-containing FMN-binding protein [Rhodococcus opacus]ANS32390.1 flavin reductase domain-containing FMN-binding protein [Rhodococcus opacus]
MHTIEKPNVAELTDAYRQAISHFSTGVAVISTRTEAGPAGMTASAVASLSIDPLQLLVCIRTDLPTRSAIEEAGQFAVNILGDGHEQLARHFATPRPDKFATVDLREGYEVPVLSDAIAHFVCKVGAALPGGDHTIIIGDVIDCGHTSGADPLVYFSRKFSSLCGPTAHARHAYDLHLELMM